MTVRPLRQQMSTPGQLSEALQIPFSDEQLEAITAPLEPNVIIAGAGTGKTTVMAARVVWLVGTGQVRPEEVLGLTFTRKAAAELGSRVSAALERAGVLGGRDDEGSEVVLTYDSFAARLVSEFGLRIGLDFEPVMVTGASRFRLATRVVRNAPGPFHSISRLSHHTIPERVLSLDAEMQSHLVSAQQVLDACAQAEMRFQQAPLWRGQVMRDVAAALAATAERRELVGLVEAYQELKRRLGVVEFADQLREAVRLASQVPEVGAELRRRFRVVLLDEYQDTSAAQARLLRELFSGPIGDDAMGFPVTAVGDPYQAIYGWRGAAAGNILMFPEHFRRADASRAERFTLSVNRRSGSRILGVGNQLASLLPVGPGEEGVELRAAGNNGAGAVAAVTFDTFPEEVAWLAEAIVGQHDKGLRWADQAVLVRRNSALAPVFEALRERDVPVEIVGLGGLIALPEVAPIVSTLRVIDDVTANPDVVALLSGPRWQLGLTDLEALGRRARDLAGRAATPEEASDALVHAVTQADPGELVSLLDAVADPGESVSPEARRRLDRFHSEIQRLRRHATDPVADLVTRVIDTLGIESELLASGRTTDQVERFITEVAGYVDIDGDGSLSGLLAYLDAEEEHGEGLQQAVPSEDDSVKLMTVHRAKGLEWNTVYLPALAGGVFPADPRTGAWPTNAATLPAQLRGDAASIPQLRDFTKDGIGTYRKELREEHRRSEDRLAYVAVTRAKQVLIASTHLWSPGVAKPRAESPYFAAIRSTAESLGTFLDLARRDADANPIPAVAARASWPEHPDVEEAAERAEAAMMVLEAATVPRADWDAWAWESATISPEELAEVAAWDESVDHLTQLLRSRTSHRVELPEGLSATALMALRRDPQAFAESLLRPMPRRPSPEALVGSRFHAWLQERFELPATLDEVEAEPAGEPERLTRLIRAFETGQFAHRVPIGVEVPFVTSFHGHLLRGRIDAVYEWGQPWDFLVVDWKTSNSPADPLQLAIYRWAWAEDRGVPIEAVGAAFYHVLRDELRMVDASPDLIKSALAAGLCP